MTSQPDQSARVSCDPSGWCVSHPFYLSDYVPVRSVCSVRCVRSNLSDSAPVRSVRSVCSVRSVRSVRAVRSDRSAPVRPVYSICRLRPSSPMRRICPISPLRLICRLRPSSPISPIGPISPIRPICARAVRSTQTFISIRQIRCRDGSQQIDRKVPTQMARAQPGERIDRTDWWRAARIGRREDFDKRLASKGSHCVPRNTLTPTTLALMCSSQADLSVLSKGGSFICC